jgi:hypothetical protein
MTDHGHAAFLIGADLNRYRTPLEAYEPSFPIRLWLAVRVCRSIEQTQVQRVWDAHILEQRRARRRRHAPRQRPFYIVTQSGRVVLGPSQEVDALMPEDLLANSSLIGIPGSELEDGTYWHAKETNEEGVQLVWASTGTSGHLPVIEMCPTQLQDQRHGDEEQYGRHRWHDSHRPFACDTAAPGAVLEHTSEESGVSSFSLPYLNLTTMEYSTSSSGWKPQADVALVVRFVCSKLGPSTTTILY